MKGLYQKYIVTKTSGKPLAEGWDGIILRIDDGLYVKACRAGALAFAEAVRDDNPLLALDIKHKILEYEVGDAITPRFSKLTSTNKEGQ